MQTHHSRYNKSIILQYMHQDTVFVATLRHPFDNFRSKFYYNQYQEGQISDVEGDPIEEVILSSSFNDTTHTYDLTTGHNLVNTMYKYFSFDGTIARTNDFYLK